MCPDSSPCLKLRPAIRLAENGFAVSPRLHQLLRDDPLLRRDAAARVLYYMESGEARPVGELLRNPELAATLRRIAADGSAALQRGDVAQRVVAAVDQRGGNLSAMDMSDYRPKRCAALFDAGKSAVCRRLHPAALASCN